MANASASVCTRREQAGDRTPASQVVVAATRLRQRSFFPGSSRARKFAAASEAHQATSLSVEGPKPEGPTLAVAADAWFRENRPRWRHSHVETLSAILDTRLLPHFGGRPIATISRADILEFRSRTQTATGRKGKGELSPSRVKHIMTALQMILADASDRYGVDSAFRNIKPLRLPKMDVHPFTLDEVNRLIATVRPDYRPYLVTRFFTGLRTGEINALEWKHIDFDADLIRVRQSIVQGVVENTKTEGLARDIPMMPSVRAALLEQRARLPEGTRWVFPSPEGAPLNLVNFTNRVWNPLLRHLGLAPRRPYQTRHTAATLMLASGENPEWVARVLGHASTEMLFRVYSRYVPNLTRNDGRAFTALVTGSPAAGAFPASLAALSRSQLEHLVQQLQSKGDRNGNA